MASNPEHRGEAVRITWILGGRRGGPKQSCTFTGPPDARLRLALAAKDLVEARDHNISREQCYTAILGAPNREAVDVAPTFAAWAREWIARLREQGSPQPGTINQYERVLRTRVTPFLGQRQLPDIDRDGVKEWVAWLNNTRFVARRGGGGKGEAKKLGDNSVRSYFTVGAQCLGAAVGTWIAANPAAIPAGQRKNHLGVPAKQKFDAVFMTADETAMILSRCDPDLADVVGVAVRTGMRRGELIALRARDVLFDRGGGATIMVRLGRQNDGSIGEPKSETSKRNITVKAVAAEILRRRVACRRPSEPVFSLPGGRRWSVEVLYDRWVKAVAAARRCPEHPPMPPPPPRRGATRQLRPDEISVCGCAGVLLRRPRFHDCRHTHASVLIAQGWPVKKIQKRLGHATFQITMDVYGHLLDLGDDAELDSMEAFFEISDRPTARVSRRPVTHRVSVHRRVHARTVPAQR
ncbi:tyrosine-type recombinase/integrase [Actinoplanes sp. NPDC051513]|uniref:tyrosine-type recombinase/integrase n=1 Tax=Actinoplanes sp. NPDC051513 TaxID=3363908 RepID=UPI0037980B92